MMGQILLWWVKFFMLSAETKLAIKSRNGDTDST